jgi:hypothetical protein
MKTYHICPKATFHSHLHLFSGHENGHYIDLADGDVLLVADFQSEQSHILWEDAHGVEHLPHPQFQGTAVIAPHHVKKINTHGHPLGVQHGDTVLHLAAKVGKVNPMFRLPRFYNPYTS